MRVVPLKLNWLDRAIQVHNYHVSQLRQDSSWTVLATAESLNRSVGSVSQDITLASWTRTHEKQLRKFNTMKDALKFIRSRNHEMRTEEI